MINNNRVRLLKKGTESNGPVIYWMSRDQRAHDNWALLFAQQLALEKNAKLVVVFTLIPEFLGATMRQYDFMLRGLMEAERELKKYNISFFFIVGQAIR
jgi:deoxyribodipyrimidine photo-lyase